MKVNEYYNPVHTYVGEHAADLLPDILEEMNLKQRRVLFVLYHERAAEQSFIRKTADRFHTGTIIFTESNPTVEQLYDVYQKTAAETPDVIVAIGGGSAMDVGKSLCCLYGRDMRSAEDVRAFIRAGVQEKPAVKWIGIPTTSGTGSEVTCWATIWDPSHGCKLSMENHQNYAYAALADPELTKTLPVKLSISSALDAAAHAMESYWAKAHNTVSRAASLRALNLISMNMEDLLAGRPEAREAMSEASLLAGLAFSNTKTTACHSISYPLTMKYHIPHGAAVAMLMGPVMKLNLPCIDEVQPLLNAMHVKDADDLNEKVKDYLSRSGQMSSLHEWGAKEEDLKDLAAHGLTKGRADNNPAEITADGILEILKSIY